MKVSLAPLDAPLPRHGCIVLVVAGLIRRGDRCLIGRRRLNDSAGGLWEFPGGKVKDGETPEDALRRELSEELDVSVDVGPWLGRALSETATRLLVLDLYAVRCQDETSTPLALEHDELRWIGAKDLSDFDWAMADLPLLDCAFDFLCR
jgi:8-oxo-dGTP diphosphatase